MRATWHCIHIPIDASYLGKSKSRSHFAGFHFLGQQHRLGTIPTTPINGGLLIRSSILDDVVVFSAAEAELGGLFENMRDSIKLRNILTDVGGYPQCASPIQTDNNCAEGIAHGTVKSKRSKAFDVRFIGYETGCTKGNSTFTGVKVVISSLITSPKIILQLITRQCNLTSSHPKQTLPHILVFIKKASYFLIYECLKSLFSMSLCMKGCVNRINYSAYTIRNRIMSVGHHMTVG